MDTRPHIRFLLGTPDGGNGVARSVLTTAGYLAAHDDIEIIGLFKRRQTPVYPVPAGVRMRFLEDLTGRPRSRTSIRGMLAASRSRLVESTASPYPGCSLLTDILLVRLLRSLRGGVLVTTRPELHLMAARFTHPSVVLVAQEHMNYAKRPVGLRQAVARRADRIGALVVLTERDRADYLAHPQWAAGRVVCIPNSMPWPVRDVEPVDSRIVVAAGRLHHQKGFDRLIDAYAPVATRHPDWRLRIYGSGPDAANLQAMIDERGITDQVRLEGWTDDLASALAAGSFFALSSRFEGLPLVAIEALSKGLPVVSFDCPRGPRELVDDGVNGLLVPNGDIAAFTSALCALIENATTRHRMSAAALETARHYELAEVGRRWDALFAALGVADPSRSEREPALLGG